MSDPIVIGDAMLYQGDCLDVLRTLPDASVQCCVTSPPYFGLRDYQTATWEGGNPDCDHANVSRWDGPKQTQGAQSGHAAKRDRLSRDECHCGAVRVDRQIGLEQTPDEYVSKLVAVFREVWRVMKDDASLWLNLGDSYASNPASGGAQSERMTGGEHKRTPSKRAYQRPNGLKPKDLIGIPWRVAFALQADGWYLRQDIIWQKPNPMPESVTDRCTKAHEYLFLLSKSKRYYFDSGAIKEPAVSEKGRGAIGRGEQGSARAVGCNGRQPQQDHSGWMGGDGKHRNRRSVWTIATKPFSGAHFAVMPPALVEPCILAGSRPGDTVLDPFSGSGTVAAVAVSHGRQAIGIDINADYHDLARARLTHATKPTRVQYDLFEEAG